MYRSNEKLFTFWKRFRGCPRFERSGSHNCRSINIISLRTSFGISASTEAKASLKALCKYGVTSSYVPPHVNGICSGARNEKSTLDIVKRVKANSIMLPSRKVSQPKRLWLKSGCVKLYRSSGGA